MPSSKTVHAFGNDILADHDAVALADLIRRRETSAAEVAQAAIARAEQVNPALNAIRLETFDAARRQSRQPLQGVFAGVPTFIKDNTDLRGLPTSQGSQAVHPRPAKADGAFARQFLQQGFVTLGKSQLPEFGLNASTEFLGQPPTRNPWHTDFSSGASSGGSAALVAAGVVPIAHANDGGGNAYGAARTLPVNIVSEGVVTRSVRDTAHFFAGAEKYFRNRKLPAIGLVEGPGRKRLRIGVVYDSITGHRSDDDTRRTVDDTARLLAGLGHHVTEMPLPITPRFIDDFSTYWGMLSFLVSRFGHRILSPDFKADELDNLTKGLAALYRRNALKTPLVLYRLRKTWDDYAKVFRDYDIVLSPVLAHTTPQLGWLSPEQPFEELFARLLQYVSFTPLNNAAGSPAISLPMGATAAGLPVAVHCSAAHGAERTLLELAFELEQAKPWRRIQDMV